MPGPTVVVSGDPTESETLTAAALCARYSDAGQGPVAVSLELDGRCEVLRVEALPEDRVETLRL